MLKHSPLLSATLKASGIELARFETYLQQKSARQPQASSAVPAALKFDESIEKAFDIGLSLSLQDRRVVVSPSDIIYGLVKSQNQSFNEMCQAVDIVPDKFFEWSQRFYARPMPIASTQDDLDKLLSRFKGKALQDVIALLHDAYKSMRAAGGSVLTVRNLLTVMVEDKRLEHCYRVLIEQLSDGITGDFAEALDFAVFQSAYFAHALGQLEVERRHLLLAVIEFYRVKAPLSNNSPSLDALNQLEALCYSDQACLKRGSIVELAPAALEVFRDLDPLAKSVFIQAARLAAERGRNYFGPEQLLQAFFTVQHPELKAFMQAVFGDDSAPQNAAHVSNSIDRYQGLLGDVFTEPVSISQPLAFAINKLNTPGERLRAAVLLRHILQDSCGLIPLILDDLGVKYAAIAENLAKLFVSQRFTHLFAYTGPPDWQVASMRERKALDMTIFSADSAVCMTAAGAYAASGDLIEPAHVLRAIIDHPDFSFLHGQNPSPKRRQVNPAPVTDGDHDLSDAVRQILVAAHELLQKRYLGRQIEPEHILLAILESFDGESGAYNGILHDYGLDALRAEMLIHGYINRKSRLNS